MTNKKGNGNNKYNYQSDNNYAIDYEMNLSE